MSKESHGSDETARFSDELISNQAPTLNLEEQSAVSALPANSALLISHRGPGAGSRFLLDQDVTVAGRHPEADIFLDDVTVSRRHVQFLRTNNSFQLEDMGSMNGTYVDGVRVDNILLTDGAEILIGKFRLTFYASQKD